MEPRCVVHRSACCDRVHGDHLTRADPSVLPLLPVLPVLPGPWINGRTVACAVRIIPGNPATTVGMMSCRLGSWSDPRYDGPSVP